MYSQQTHGYWVPVGVRHVEMADIVIRMGMLAPVKLDVLAMSKSMHRIMITLI